MNHISLCSLAVLLIAGCTNLKQIENDQELVSNSIAEDVELVNQLRLDDRKYRNITMVQSIFVPPTTEAEQTKPDWWFDNVQSAANDVNLKTALKTVLSDHYINYQFQAGVDTTNKLINFKGKTVGGAIESIASASGYSYKVISDNKIIWSLYETRTFSIAAGPGTDIFAQGKGEGENAGDGNKNISSGTEFASANGSYDALQEAYEELKALSSFNSSSASASLESEVALSPEQQDAVASSSNSDAQIPIYVSRSASTITVKDKPSVLDEMEALIKNKNRLLRTQVLLEIDIIELKLSNEAAKAWDLSIALADLGKYGAEFATSTAVRGGASLVGRHSTAMPTNIISAELTKGRGTGTQLLMEVLRNVGAVSSRTLPRQTMTHNSIAKLRDVENLMFVKERTATNTANVGTEISFSQDEIEYGFSLYVLPTIFEEDVLIRMATNISSLIDIIKSGESEIGGDEEGSTLYVQSPWTQHKDFLSKYNVADGDTLVISGLSREKKTTKNAKGVHDAVAKADFSKTERTETIMAITPRIIRPKSY